MARTEIVEMTEGVERAANRRSLDAVVIRYCWAMPASCTFDVPEMGLWVKNYLRKSKLSIDPFARNKRWATITNDLNEETRAEYHLNALDFLKMLKEKNVRPDLVIFDPPYSVQQCKTSYNDIGASFGADEVTMAWGGWSKEKALINEIASLDAKVLCFGWSSVGMGMGWTKEEMLLVCHGAGHNDTLCVAEKRAYQEAQLLATDNARTQRPRAASGSLE